MKSYVVSILVKNHSGVLRRVSGLFSRRDYNIESLTVSSTEESNVSRITVVVTGDEYIIEQITKQVMKLVEVVRVERLRAVDSVFRELVLIKVGSTKEDRGQVLEICKIFDAKVVDAYEKSLILELTGDSTKITSFLRMLEPYKILELVRTGLTALQRGENQFKNFN